MTVVGPYRTHSRCRHVVLPYFVRSQVRTRYFGVSLTLYRPVDENSNIAPIMRCYDVTREHKFSHLIEQLLPSNTWAHMWLLHNVIATPYYYWCPIRNKSGLHHLCESAVHQSLLSPFVATRGRVGLQVGRANQASFVRLLRCAGIGLTHAYTHP